MPKVISSPPRSATRTEGRTRGRASAEVRCRWVTRKFPVPDDDPATGERRSIIEPVPIVQIPRPIMKTIAAETNVPLTAVAHKRIEELVAGRILNVCGFTDFGADGNSMFIPVTARPEAREIIEKAGTLLNALDAFDQMSNKAASKRFDPWIEADCGASPRVVLQAIREMYRRYLPDVPKTKQIGMGVFMADIRDQILAKLVDDWDSMSHPQRTKILKVFLAKLNEHVLQPLSRRGRIAAPPVRAPNLKSRGTIISIALANSANCADALRHPLKHALAPYDQQQAVAAAHHFRARSRLNKGFSDAGFMPSVRKK
jgi:hypothetical protein